MLSYLALTRMAVRRTFVYRSAVLAGLVTNFFFGLLRAAVMIALFQSQSDVSGIDVHGAITFTALTQACIGYLALFGWYEIVHSVHTGQVGADLLKPMSFFGFWMAQDFGRALVNFLLRGLPIVAFFVLFFDITYPASFGQWAALAAALFLSWLVSFAFRFLINLAAFWTPNAVGFCRLFYVSLWFLSGFMAPLRFFPDWFIRLCYWTPFPQMVNTPAEIFLGLLPPGQTAAALALQLAWAIGLILAGGLILNAGVHRLVIQGG